MNEPLELAVTMGSPSRNKDDSVKLPFTSAYEVDTDGMALLDSYRKRNGRLYFYPDGTHQAAPEPPKENAVKEEKSKSQVLRLGLWRLWKERHEGKITWAVFYDKEMDHITQKVLDAID